MYLAINLKIGKKCENYRPILILPIISKIFERSLFSQLYEFLNANNLLSKHQFGFRPKYFILWQHSDIRYNTAAHVVNSTNKIFDVINNRVWIQLIISLSRTHYRWITITFDNVHIVVDLVSFLFIFFVIFFIWKPPWKSTFVVVGASVAK